MWRKRVLMRVDLKSKLNEPLQSVAFQNDVSVYNQSTDGYYRNTKGMMLAILNAYLNSKGTAEAFAAYNPDTLDREISMDQVKKMLKERSNEYYKEIAAKALVEESGKIEEGDSGSAEEGGGDDFGGFGDFGDFGGDDFGGDLSGFGTGDDLSSDAGTADVAGTDAGSAAAGSDGGFKQAYLESKGETYYPIFEIVEDRIFDRSKSSMYYDKLYIRIFHVQPQSTGTEMRPVCAFRFSDVKNILANCMWKNPNNDAEARNALEILDSREFDAMILNLSGESVSSIQVAEKRRIQLVEYEHHLWQY